MNMKLNFILIVFAMFSFGRNAMAFPWSKKFQEPNWTKEKSYQDPFKDEPNWRKKYNANIKQVLGKSWQERIAEELPCSQIQRPKKLQFCAQSEGVNFVNAFWLACLSANQYFNYTFIYKDLVNNLGFAKSDERSMEDLIDKRVALISKYKSKYPKKWNDIFEFSQKTSKKRKKTDYSKVKSFEKEFKQFMAEKTWLIDQAVHANARRHRNKKIGFFSSNPDDESIDKVGAFREMLIESGYGFLSFTRGEDEDQINKKIEKLSLGGTQVLWAEHDDFISISVRGTEGKPEDALTDLVAFQTMFDIAQKNGKKKSFTALLHTGFNTAARDVLGYIVLKAGFHRKKVAEYNKNVEKEEDKILPKPIYVTGHSLGGAVATLIGARLMLDNFKDWISADPRTINVKPSDYANRIADSYSREIKGAVNHEQFCNELLPPAQSVDQINDDFAPKSRIDLIKRWQLNNKKHLNNVKGIYTFGAPRVGDETFKLVVECVAKRTGTTIARFRNNGDIVPTVPYYNKFAVLPYAHIGTQVVFADSRPTEFRGRRRVKRKEIRVPHINLAAPMPIKGSKFSVLPLTDFYQSFLPNDNYVLMDRDTDACEFGSKCSAYNSPYYMAQKKSHPDKLSNNLIRLMLNAGLNISSVLKNIKDHGMGPAPASPKVSDGISYVENIRRVLPEDMTDLNCSDLEIKEEIKSVTDVTFDKENRSNMLLKLKDQIKALSEKDINPKLLEIISNW